MLCTMFLLFQFGTLYTLVFVAILLLGAVVAALLHRRQAKTVLLIAVSCLASVLCFSYTYNGSFIPSLAYCGENIPLCGTVAEYPQKTGEHSYTYVLKNCKIDGKATDLNVALYDKYLYVCEPGDILQFTATQLQAYESDPDWKSFYVLADGVWLYAFTDSVEIEHYSGSRLQYAAKDLQHYVLKILEDRLPQPEAGVLSALILGQKDTMDAQTEVGFQLCGLAHLFAVSGLHLTFWVSFVLQFFGKRRRHKTPTLAAIGFTIFFMALTGFSVSVCRSGFMMIVLLTGNLFRRETDALNSLGFAVAVLLTLNPFSAISASLLLSVGATATIVLTASSTDTFLIKPILRKVSNDVVYDKLHTMLGILFTSATTLTALLPLNAYFFGNFSLLAPLSNLLCVPAAQFAMIFGSAAAASNPIPYFSDCLFAITEQLLRFVIFISQKIADLPFAVYHTHLPSVFAWAATCAVVLFGVYYFNKRNRKRIFITAMCCFCALYFGLNVSSFVNTERLSLTVCDTGNDICITLHDTHGNAAVIGTGNNAYLAESVYRNLHFAGVIQPCLLLIPHIKTDANTQIINCINLWQPQTVLSAVNFKHTDDTVITASESSVSLWEDVSLHYQSDETFSAISITTSRTKILICCTPYSDFTDCDEVFKSGDILICRQSVPQTLCTDSFQQIILSCDKEKESYRFTDDSFSEKVICTADEGNITLTIG